MQMSWHSVVCVCVRSCVRECVRACVGHVTTMGKNRRIDQDAPKRHLGPQTLIFIPEQFFCFLSGFFELSISTINKSLYLGLYYFILIPTTAIQSDKNIQKRVRQ